MQRCSVQVPDSARADTTFVELFLYHYFLFLLSAQSITIDVTAR